MRCDQAIKLFDAHLDGELAPSLEMELAAHRFNCPQCRRQLALLEVAGHVIESDAEPPAALDDAFTDRLLACVDEQRPHAVQRAVRWIYLAVPLAAAAVICFAFLGAFDRGDVIVAGKSMVNPGATPAVGSGAAPFATETLDQASGERESAERALEEFLTDIQSNVNEKRDRVQSLRDSLDLTIRQWLDILNSRKDPTADDAHFPALDELKQPKHDGPQGDRPNKTPNNIEDL
ncbi:MAG: anti-sigma factor family protein [Phycisphaerae bacterium]